MNLSILTVDYFVFNLLFRFLLLIHSRLKSENANENMQIESEFGFLDTNNNSAFQSVPHVADTKEIQVVSIAKRPVNRPEDSHLRGPLIDCQQRRHIAVASLPPSTPYALLQPTLHCCCPPSLFCPASAGVAGEC